MAENFGEALLQGFESTMKLQQLKELMKQNKLKEKESKDTLYIEIMKNQDLIKSAVAARTGGIMRPAQPARTINVGRHGLSSIGTQGGEPATPETAADFLGTMSPGRPVLTPAQRTISVGPGITLPATRPTVEETGQILTPGQPARPATPEELRLQAASGLPTAMPGFELKPKKTEEDILKLEEQKLNIKEKELSIEELQEKIKVYKTQSKDIKNDPAFTFLDKIIDNTNQRLSKLDAVTNKSEYDKLITQLDTYTATMDTYLQKQGILSKPEIKPTVPFTTLLDKMLKENHALGATDEEIIDKLNTMADAFDETDKTKARQIREFIKLNLTTPKDKKFKVKTKQGVQG